MKKLLQEIHDRSLWQVLGIYLAGSWVVLQVVDQLVQSAGLPDWVPSLALVLLLIGLPMVLATAIAQRGISGANRAAESKAADPVVAGARVEPSSAGATRPSSSAPTRAEASSWFRSKVFTWRNAIAGGIAALALFGAATAVWMVLRGAGVGTAGTLVARGLIDDGERVVLADFSGDSALAVAATAALRVQLAESGVVSVAEPSVVSNALERMGAASEPLDLRRAREVAEREGLKAIVGGDVSGAGDSYIITARVMETASGDELVTVGETAKSTAEFLDAMDRLGRKLRERLGESLGSIRAAAPLARATTSSTEALRKYSRAETAFDARDLDQTITLLDEAIALDSSFAMAWRKLAVADPDRREEAATRAYELRDRLTERERYHTVGIYHTYVTEDLDQAINTFRALLDEYPDDATALNNLGVNYANQGQLELAAEMYERALDVDPYSAHYYNNLISTLYRIGQADSARNVLDRFAENFPDHPNVAWNRSYFAYADGDVETAEADLVPLLGSEVLSIRRAANGEVSDLRVREGKLREGEQIWRQSVEDLTPLREAMWRSWLDLEVRRDTAGAVERVERAVEEAPDSLVDDFVGDLANFFYAVGSVERGDAYYERQQVVDSLQIANTPERFRALQQGIHEVGRSMALRDYDAAIDRFRDTEAAWLRISSGQDPATWAIGAIEAYEAAGMADTVIARYEAWLGRRQLDGRAGADATQLAHAYERLGQLYDAKGDLERAAGYYGRFVDLWADADPELQPRVEAARTRLEEIVRERG
jgi:eukaryotic-like serine/threonine-protein kinase